jgi:hypothetical protein
VVGGKIDIGFDNGVVLDAEAALRIHRAETAFVVGAAGGDLQENGVGLTGRPEHISLVVHLSMVCSANGCLRLPLTLQAK